MVAYFYGLVSVFKKECCFANNTQKVRGDRELFGLNYWLFVYVVRFGVQFLSRERQWASSRSTSLGVLWVFREKIGTSEYEETDTLL